MPEESHSTDEFRGARITRADFTGATLRACELRELTIVDSYGLTSAELEQTCARPPAPGYPEEPRTVGQCLRVVMAEECEHRRYAIRDLAVLEQANSGNVK
jgi:uncharacterized protein YjbI with pentapeptide repeats